VARIIASARPPEMAQETAAPASNETTTMTLVT
jgi:hypothetical protein